MAVESAILVTAGTSLASGLLKSLVQKSVNALSESYSAAGLKSALFGNLKEQLTDLNRELSRLDALLCSGPVHHNPNPLLLDWLKRVEEAATFADYLLDDISYEQIRSQVESSPVSNLLLCGSDASFGFRMKIGSKISKCMSMIADIYTEAAKIGLKPVELLANPSSYEPPAGMSADLREVRENVDTSFVVGREADEKLIVDELCQCHPNDDQVLRVIAIVGMSGVGKTTLARKVYDNVIVTEQYKKKIWIFVSDNFNLRKFLAEMLQSLTTVVNTDAPRSVEPNIDAMEKRLKECLEKERYLLVLDDVWNKNQRVWDSIRTSLVRVANGCTGSSIVLVTTQLEEVASVMGASLTHRVKILSEDDSRELFKGKAFANKTQEQVSDLRDIGERILNKCGRLPLAINTMASLLSTMNERSQWESVERSQLWNLPQGQIDIMPWLLVSFNHLPSAAIKQCFAHCSICLPKGIPMDEVYLISSWIAQGFIQLPLPQTSEKERVAIAQTYIKSMLAHGLLQIYNDDDDNRQRYNLHDLMHALADYVSRDKYLTIREPNDLHKASSGVEHVLIHGRNTFTSQLEFPKGNTQSILRTLLCRNATISIDLVVEARFLCELELIDCGINEIPRSIGGLKHLRRFVFNDSLIKYLPESICSLYNLQVLDLERCDMLVELPQQVTKLLNLREIYTTVAVHIPKGLGQLTRLTKLPLIKLKAGDGCRIKELGNLKNPLGILAIKQLENISCKEDAMEVDLKGKAGIEVLRLEWSSEGNEGDIICTIDEEVMEGLQPHSNLKELSVDNFRAKKFSSWLSSGLHCINLKKLTLVNCKRCEELPTIGCLPYLKYLTIDGMESVELIGSDFFSCTSIGSQIILFPSLIEFKLLNMPKLKRWLDPLGLCASTFPCLEILHMSNCPSLVSVPSCFHSLQRLHIEGMNSGEPLLVILSNSNKLTSLTVENVEQLTSLFEPLLKCTSLRLLKIKDCMDLVELPPTLQSLSSLETLSVENCDSLTSLPGIEGLLSLRILEIRSCKLIIDTPCGLERCMSIERLKVVICHNMNFNPELAISSTLQHLEFYRLSKQMSIPRWLNQLSNLSQVVIGGFNSALDNIDGIEHLPKSLKRLTLVGWPNLKSLPDELQALTQLEFLIISLFDGLTELPEWLGGLSSLQSLRIFQCKNMKHLPSLDAIRRLTRLGKLIIQECPELGERCRKEGGEEWRKISHLPHIEIIESESKASDEVEAKRVVEAALQVTIGSSVASGLVKALLHKSANLLSESSSSTGLNKSSLFGNLKSQLAQLKRELEKLDALLCGAERLPPAHHNRNPLLLQLLGGINKAANFTDNLLDDISYEQIRRRAERNTVSIGSLGFRIAIGRKLNKCLSMIAEIYKEAAKIGLKPVEMVENLRENVETSNVVGREADEEVIVGELCRPNNDELLGVIAIVGIPGVGKTTLARKIYGNEMVTKQYKNKVWISLTHDFNLRRLLDAMLQSLTGVSHNIPTTDEIEMKLNSCLEKKRYLLVLDDVWNMNQQVWDSIRTSLVRVANGCTGSSMLLVTTTLKKVASVMGATLSYDVKLLSKDDSRELFESKAFVNKSSKQASNLRVIGERILSNCGGLPLEINTLASLLATMNERSQWKSVYQSQVWNLFKFNLLPSAVIRRCFAHCSILISKGENVSEGYLISSWIAQGFIQLPEISDDDLWTIGRLYTKSMCDYGLLRIYSDNGYYKRFTMPGRIHDLAVYVSGDKYLTIREPDDMQKASSEVEHALIHGGNSLSSQLNFPKGNTHSTLRTLICHHVTVSIDLVVQARFLRQLELKDCGLKEIPRSIGRLKHLRRFVFNDSPIKYLPESIGSLYNLKVLDLERCDMLVELPQKITKLLNLKEIYTTVAVHLPKGLGQLTCLTKLPLVKLKAGNGCRIRELGCLKNLVGILVIKQLENISCKEDAMEANLEIKAGIEVMKLGWSSEGNEGNLICPDDEEVMKGLQPHSNLKELWVVNFRAKRFSLWLSSGHCNNLTDLTLVSCKRCEQLPTLGCLPSLKILAIGGMDSIEVIGSDFFASSDNTGSQRNLFPSLEKLIMWNMSKLKEWFDPSGSCASAFPRLRILSISDCPSLASVPSFFYSLQRSRNISPFFPSLLRVRVRVDIKGINSGEPLFMILSNSNMLTSLTIENVQRLTCLSEPLLKCISLQRLKIKGCKELVELAPTLQSLKWLMTLSVEDCDSLTSLPDMEGLLFLQILEISRCKLITETPCDLERCVSIVKLTVVDCHKLNFNPESNTSRWVNLRVLKFYNLLNQMSIPRWLNHISKLTSMTVGGFNNELDNICGIEHLPKYLKSLTLVGWPKLKSLPDEVQSLTQLETLGITQFEGLTTLPGWLGNLFSLQSLRISNCRNMKHLPSVDAMQRLTQLRELIIKECPMLGERCRKEGGEEWPKISHLPCIHINEGEAADGGSSADEVTPHDLVDLFLRPDLGFDHRAAKELFIEDDYSVDGTPMDVYIPSLEPQWT